MTIEWKTPHPNPNCFEARPGEHVLRAWDLGLSRWKWEIRGPGCERSGYGETAEEVKSTCEKAYRQERELRDSSLESRVKRIEKWISERDENW